jgi:uncharacterized protein YoxC
MGPLLEIRKTGLILQNLDYARSSLSRLEQEAMTMLAPGRKGDLQADLNKKRELLDSLVDRLQDFQKVSSLLYG